MILEGRSITLTSSFNSLETIEYKQRERLNMDMEQRARYMEEIQKLEGLLAHAVAHGEKEEEDRIRAELVREVEAL